MIPSDIIAKKRNGEELKSRDISWFLNEYLKDNITDAQMSAFLMAIYFNGMSDIELLTLVNEMLNSGNIIEFEKSELYVADKHSTGGIGDKTSLILAPIMAAAGLRIPMIAGRSLEYTGGTIDKLESIPGINISPTLNQFKSWVNNIGCAIISQSKEICPADNKMYALRNQTATVPSIPIIASSIMSKKIAEGISGLVMDIKIGNGAFMKTKNQAFELSKLIRKIAESYEINIDIIYSNMNQPLGKYAGLGCEIKEAIDCLKGNGPQDLMTNTFELCSCLLLQSGKAENKEKAKLIFDSIIESGKGYELFQKMVSSQNGQLDQLEKNILPEFEKIVRYNKSGTINHMNTEKIGWALIELGCGYKKGKDYIDYTAGIEFFVKPGDEIKEGEPIYRLFNSDMNRLNTSLAILTNTIKTEI